MKSHLRCQQPAPLKPVSKSPISKMKYSSLEYETGFCDGSGNPSCSAILGFSRIDGSLFPFGPLRCIRGSILCERVCFIHLGNCGCVVRRNDEELRELNVIQDFPNVRIKIRQNHSNAGILSCHTSPRKKTQPRRINVRDLGKIDDEFFRPRVDKVLHLLSQVGPITAGQEFSAQAHNYNIVGETCCNSHG